MVVPKVIGIIQARMGSTRLPGKILAPIIENLPLLAVLAKRVTSSDLEWWIATTTESSDDIIEIWAHELGLKIFRGESEDVLSRYLVIANSTKSDWVIRVTADDPFMDRETVNKLIAMIPNLDTNVDLVCDIPSKKKFPLGYIPELVRVDSLNRASALIAESETFHRQHVTSYLLQNNVQQITYPNASERSNWRWTVDTLEDLLLVREVFQLMGPSWHNMTYEEIVKIVDHNPSLLEINSSIRQKSIEEG